MRKLVRCHNQFKGESKKQTYVYISDTEINVQMEAGLAASAAGVEGGEALEPLPGGICWCVDDSSLL